MGDGPVPPMIDPEEYARLVSRTSDDDLRAGLRENGEQIVEAILRAMPQALRPDAAADGRVVAEWMIHELADGQTQRWQVIIDDAQCTVLRDGDRKPDFTFTIGALDFIKLVTGNAKGPTLFMLGRLRIRGDLLRAARYQAYFRTPRVKARAAHAS